MGWGQGARATWRARPDPAVRMCAQLGATCGGALLSTQVSPAHASSLTTADLDMWLYAWNANATKPTPPAANST